MLAFPNAKINLGLNVTGILPDGFHTIESGMIPVAFRDALEIIPSSGPHIEFRSSGLTIPGKEDENLCIRAYSFLKDDLKIPPVKMHLHKVIPMGAGLGGGSSDAAFTIKLLNGIFNLQLSRARMLDYAMRLGSDCAFFIDDKPVLASGRGDQFETVDLNLSGYSIVIVIPQIHVNTSEAYTWVPVKKPDETIPAVLKSSPREWKDRLVNDFEFPVFNRYPAILKIKEDLYKTGAIYASMSGSGSAVYGLYKTYLPDIRSFEGCFTWTGTL